MYGQSNRPDPPSQPEWRLPPRPPGGGPPPPPPPPATYTPATYGPISNPQIQGVSPTGSGADTTTWGVRFNQTPLPLLGVGLTVRGMKDETNIQIPRTSQHQKKPIHTRTGKTDVPHREYQSLPWVPPPSRSPFSVSI